MEMKREQNPFPFFSAIALGHLFNPDPIQTNVKTEAKEERDGQRKMKACPSVRVETEKAFHRFVHLSCRDNETQQKPSGRYGINIDEEDDVDEVLQVVLLHRHPDRAATCCSVPSILSRGRGMPGKPLLKT